jgi:hypothetical protein
MSEQNKKLGYEGLYDLSQTLTQNSPIDIHGWLGLDKKKSNLKNIHFYVQQIRLMIISLDFRPSFLIIIAVLYSEKIL